MRLLFIKKPIRKQIHIMYSFKQVNSFEMGYKTLVCCMTPGEKGCLRKREDWYIEPLTQHKHQPLKRKQLVNENRVWPQTTYKAWSACTCEHKAWCRGSPFIGNTLFTISSKAIPWGWWANKRPTGIPKHA